jgi:hypothetical protein
VDAASIRLNHSVRVSPEHPVEADDHDNVVKMKFERAEVIQALGFGRGVSVQLTGTVAGACFGGTDSITVLVHPVQLAGAPDPGGCLPEADPELADVGQSATAAPAGADAVGPVFALKPRNPAVGELVVRFSLPDGAPATLSVYDVTGRRVASREVGSGAPGWRDAGLGELPAGMYVVLLSQAHRALSSRVAVLR